MSHFEEDGQDSTPKLGKEQDDARWGHMVTNETGALLTQFMQDTSPMVTAVTGEEDYLKLGYTWHVAKVCMSTDGAPAG